MGPREDLPILVLFENSYSPLPPCGRDPGRMRQIVVPKMKNSACLATSSAVDRERGISDLVPPCSGVLDAGLGKTRWPRDHNSFGLRSTWRADQRNHNLGITLDSIATPERQFENGRACISRDLGIRDGPGDTRDGHNMD